MAGSSRVNHSQRVARSRHRIKTICWRTRAQVLKIIGVIGAVTNRLAPSPKTVILIISMLKLSLKRIEISCKKSATSTRKRNQIHATTPLTDLKCSFKLRLWVTTKPNPWRTRSRPSKSRWAKHVKQLSLNQPSSINSTINLTRWRSMRKSLSRLQKTLVVWDSHGTCQTCRLRRPPIRTLLKSPHWSKVVTSRCTRTARTSANRSHPQTQINHRSTTPPQMLTPVNRARSTINTLWYRQETSLSRLGRPTV